MIDRVTFELDDGRKIRPWEDYGVIMARHNAPPPVPRVTRIKIDGRDGEIDVSEWAGRVIYENREVEITLRDLHGRIGEVIDRLHGRNMKITFSEAPEYYLYGRCDAIEPETRRRVTDIDMRFTCQPYRMRHEITRVALPLDGTTEKILYPKHMFVRPRMSADFSSGLLNLTLDGASMTIPSAEYTKSTYTLRRLLDDTPHTVSGTRAGGASGNVVFSWRDGVL